MFFLNVFIFSIIIIPYFFSYGKRYGLSPVTVFLFMEMVMFYGICFSSLGQETYAVKLESLYVSSIFFFILGVECSKRIYVRNTGNVIEDTFRDEDLNSSQMIVVWSIIVVAVILCTYLFVSQGMNVFITSMMSFFSKSYSSLQEARRGFRSVNGIGYIYQFRVVLLPILATYIFFCEKGRVKRCISLPLYLVMIIFLLGTGQRNAFVFYCLFLILFARHMRNRYSINILSKSEMIIFLSGAALFMIVLTISNGRADESNIILSSVQSIITRIMNVDQVSAIVGFKYIDTQDTVWGYDWLRMIEQILPGHSTYLSVANISYYMMYGTYAGTNPPCLWGSAWYNFNIFGVTLFPFIVGYSYHNVYKGMKRFSNKNTFYILIYVGLCTYLGVWTSGTPMTLFNNGVITLLILRWLVFGVFGNKYME